MDYYFFGFCFGNIVVFKTLYQEITADSIMFEKPVFSRFYSAVLCDHYNRFPSELVLSIINFSLVFAMDLVKNHTG